MSAALGMRQMKKMLWLLGGVCAASAGFLMFGRGHRRPVEELAHKLEEAWADHHTMA